MGRRSKAPDSRPRHEEPAPRERDAASPFTPSNPRTPAETPPPERSEDFGRRRDIESADESPEEHDRRHHDPDAIEVGKPV